MKNIFLGLLFMTLFSCSTTYYQVYKVKPASEIRQTGKAFLYEDENCDISYNFWSEGGNVGFMIYNKTDKDIYVNMNESFFIRNGIANDYFKNREFTSLNSTSQSSMYTYSATNTYGAIAAIFGVVVSELEASKTASTGKGVSNTISYGVNIKEKDIITIPPQSKKVISGYYICESLYRDCNLYLKPSRNKIKTLNFSEGSSPFVFSNRIAYRVEGQNTTKKIEQKFYVSAITNYPEDEITEKNVVGCKDEQSSQKAKFFKNITPDKFYIRYDKRSFDTKH